MDAKELIKWLVVILLFAGVAPLGGLALRNCPRGQRVVFSLMCLMTLGGLFAPAEWGLTLGSIETYRGHTKGYHFYLVQCLALTLSIALWREEPKRFRWLPPGLWLYLLYCGLSLLSILNAPVANYAGMAAFRCTTMSVLFVATYNYIRTKRELETFLTAMAFALFWEFLVVLKWKYLHHIYQVRGTFEHQNPLCMYATMIGLVLLAAGASRGNLLLGGYLVSAAIVQSTLSRAGLAVFALGSILTVIGSLLDQPTKRRLLTVGFLGFVGFLGLVLALDTILSRFNDQGNESSGQTRDLLNIASQAMVRDYPLGIGWNNFALAINAPFAYGDVIDDWERDRGHKVDEDYAKGVVESHYYLLLAETGYQGLVSYLVFVGVFLWWNWRGLLAFRRHWFGCISLGIAAGCACNYLQSAFERVLTQPRNMMLWMLLLGVTACIETWRRDRALAV